MFPVTLETFEADTQVSADEMRRWHERDWLSFNPDRLLTFDWSEDTELTFVKAIVRSGLVDEWIEKLLRSLTKPYCYDADQTFYSFATRCWISLPLKPVQHLEEDEEEEDEDDEDEGPRINR